MKLGRFSQLAAEESFILDEEFTTVSQDDVDCIVSEICPERILSLSPEYSFGVLA